MSTHTRNARASLTARSKVLGVLPAKARGDRSGLGDGPDKVVLAADGREGDPPEDEAGDDGQAEDFLADETVHVEHGGDGPAHIANLIMFYAE